MFFDERINDTENPQTSICLRYEDEFPCETVLVKFHKYSELFAPDGKLEQASIAHFGDKVKLAEFHAWYDQTLYGNFNGEKPPTWQYGSEEEIAAYRGMRDMDQLEAAGNFMSEACEIMSEHGMNCDDAANRWNAQYDECIEAKRVVDPELMKANAHQAEMYLEEAGINAEACLGPACKPFNTLLEDYTYCCMGCCMAGDFKEDKCNWTNCNYTCDNATDEQLSQCTRVPNGDLQFNSKGCIDTLQYCKDNGVRPETLPATESYM